MKNLLAAFSLVIVATTSTAFAEFTSGNGLPLEHPIVEKIIAQALASAAPENQSFQKLQKQFRDQKLSSSPQCELYNETYQPYAGYAEFPVAHIIHCWDYVSAVETKDGVTAKHILSYTYDGLLVTNFSDFRVLFLEKGIKKQGEFSVPKLGGKSSSSGG